MSVQRRGTPKAKQWHSKLHTIAERDGWRCAYCFKTVVCGLCQPDSAELKATRDHFIPFARGGSNRNENLRVSCYPCNVRKADHDPTQDARSRRKHLTFTLAEAWEYAP